MQVRRTKHRDSASPLLSRHLTGIAVLPQKYFGIALLIINIVVGVAALVVLRRAQFSSTRLALYTIVLLLSSVGMRGCASAQTSPFRPLQALAGQGCQVPS